MPAWGMQVFQVFQVCLLLLLEGGVVTKVGATFDQEDIVRIEDRWKEYRNIGSEEDLQSRGIKDAGENNSNDQMDIGADINKIVLNDTLIQSEEMTNISAPIIQDQSENNAMVGQGPNFNSPSITLFLFQVGFESTLGGMMEAMREIQAKGDLMM